MYHCQCFHQRVPMNAPTGTMGTMSLAFTILSMHRLSSGCTARSLLILQPGHAGGWSSGGHDGHLVFSPDLLEDADAKGHELSGKDGQQCSLLWAGQGKSASHSLSSSEACPFLMHASWHGRTFAGVALLAAAYPGSWSARYRTKGIQKALCRARSRKSAALRGAVFLKHDATQNATCTSSESKAAWNIHDLLCVVQKRGLPAHQARGLHSAHEALCKLEALLAGANKAWRLHENALSKLGCIACIPDPRCRKCDASHWHRAAATCLHISAHVKPCMLLPMTLCSECTAQQIRLCALQRAHQHL